MKNLENIIDIVLPKNQLFLYGYNKYFNDFIKLINKKKLPNSILLSGPSGSGKSTFAFHLINYMLSKNEENKYELKDQTINHLNNSFIKLKTNTHPNFYLIECDKLNKEIKVDQIRSLINFINKSTYSIDLKIILIDNCEKLNVNAYNTLLKSLEEASTNTHFFLVHNNSFKIPETIKSRCNEFKIFHSLNEKEIIFNKLCHQYNLDYQDFSFSENYFFDTPGAILKNLSYFGDNYFSICKDSLKFIQFIIDKYNKKKDPELLYSLSQIITKFYHELYNYNYKNINVYSLNLSKILKLINNIKKFNLDEKASFFFIKDILYNDAK